MPGRERRTGACGQIAARVFAWFKARCDKSGAKCEVRSARSDAPRTPHPAPRTFFFALRTALAALRTSHSSSDVRRYCPLNLQQLVQKSRKRVEPEHVGAVAGRMSRVGMDLHEKPIDPCRHGGSRNVRDELGLT